MFVSLYSSSPAGNQLTGLPGLQITHTNAHTHSGDEEGEPSGERQLSLTLLPTSQLATSQPEEGEFGEWKTERPKLIVTATPQVSQTIFWKLLNFPLLENDLRNPP